MAPSPYHPKEFFLAAFRDDLLAAICQQVLLAYQDSHQYCDGNFDEEEAHDLYPKERRAMVERNVRHIAKQFPGVTAGPATNRIGSAYHLRIQSGPVLLTISAVQSRLQMVRDARFRQQYARDPQRSLFTSDVPPPVSAQLFALLLHVPDKKRRHLPAHMNVVFPDADCKRYLDSIDLLQRFQRLTVPAVPDVQIPKPRLRKIVKPREQDE